MDTWGGVYRWEYAGQEILVVPTIHPAAVMRTKLQAEKLLVDRPVARAGRVASGRGTWPVAPEVVVDPPAGVLHGVMSKARTVVIGTEFNPEREETWIIGLMVDTDPRVWSITARAMTGAVRAVLKHHFARGD